VHCAIVDASELLQYERAINPLKATHNPLRWASYVAVASRSLSALAKAAGDCEIQVLDTNSLRAHLYGTILAKRLRIPLVWHIRDIYTKRWVRALFALSATETAAILPVSLAAAHSLPLVGSSRGRIEILHNTVDIDAIFQTERGCSRDEIRRQLGVVDCYPVVGLIGQIVAWKGHNDFVLAARDVALRFPRARFLIVGDSLTNSEDYKHQLVAEVERLGLSDVVRFVGFRDDIYDVIAALDVVVNASWAEPLGATIMQGMALGRPVVATDAGGTPEIIQDGVTGLLVPPKAPERLAAAIVRLAANESLAAQMGSRGRERIVAEFDIRSEISKLAAIYSRVTKLSPQTAKP
jgi:glycosyltransferase involved in cell wall biosynthesis